MRFKSQILTHLLAAVLIVLVFAFHHLRQTLRFQNLELKERLSPRAHQNDLPVSASEDMGAGSTARGPQASRELLRLRGEAGRLREQRREQEKLEAENAKLRAELLAEAFLHREFSREEIDAYLVRNGRNGQSLLNAYRVTGDKALLQEALQAAPNDPQVLLTAAASVKEDQARRQSLEAPKQATPNNALANYFSAQDFFKSGQTEQAMQELAAAAAKSDFGLYSLEAFNAMQNFYLELGYPEAAAQAAAWQAHDYQCENILAQLERNIRDQMLKYQKSGDEASSRALLNMGLQLGRRLADGPNEFQTLDVQALGLAIQRRLLQAAATGGPALELAVQSQLAEVTQRREALALLDDPPGWENYQLKRMSEAEVIEYFNRVKANGEIEARRWAAARSGDQQ